MTILLVSRYPATLERLQSDGIKIDKYTPHFSIQACNPGDTVIGSLPVPLVSQITAKGLRYIHLSMEIPRNLSGRPLTADDMQTIGYDLKAYDVIPYEVGLGLQTGEIYL